MCNGKIWAHGQSLNDTLYIDRTDIRRVPTKPTYNIQLHAFEIQECFFSFY